MVPVARFVVLVLLVTGCISSSDREIRRGASWALPGGPVFVSFVDEKTTKTTAFTFAKNDDDDMFKTTRRTSKMRTWPIAIDLATGQTTQLAWARGDISPFYWDRQRRILWVADDHDRSIVGLSTTGVTYAGAKRWATFVNPKGLPPPFAIASERGETRIWNAASQAEIAIDDGLWGEVYMDGSLMRIVRTVEESTAVLVSETVIDWSNPAAPTLRPGLQWQTPPLPGTRRAYGISGNGRAFVEVVELAEGQRVISHDLISGVVHILPVVLGASARLEALGGDLVAAVEDVEIESRVRCWSGYVLDTASGKLAPLGREPCVVGASRPASLSQAVLMLSSSRYGHFDVASGGVVDLGVVTAASVLGPTTLLLARSADGAYLVEQLELSTGKVTSLARRAQEPTMLYREGDLLVVGQGEELYTQRISDARDDLLRVPAGPGDGPGGMMAANEVSGVGVRPDRTKLWLSVGLGATNQRVMAIDMSAQLRRWWTNRLALAGGLALYTDFSEPDQPATYLATRGTVGAYHYLRPIYGGWYAGAELGVGAGWDRRDRVASFVASAAASVGYQGGLFGVSASALAPTLFDTSARGVAFIVGLRIGMYGTNL